MTAPLDLDAAQALAEAASPRRWSYDDGITSIAPEVERGKCASLWAGHILVAELYGDDAADGTLPALATMDANGRFIAAARTLVPSLLAAVRDRDAEIARLREAMAALVAALPKCDECKTRPGERIEEGYLYCIEHGHGMRGVEYTRPLRAALDLLQETAATKGPRE